MNRRMSILMMIVLVSCSVVHQAETPTRASITPTSTIQPTTEIVPIGDGGLITEEPCASPCFFGIRIGETSLNQVIPTLRDYGISPCELFNERIVVCGNKITIGVDSSTSIVNGVEYDPDTSISVEKIIEKYGDPNALILELDSTGTPEGPKLIAFLMWDSIKMMIELSELTDQGEHTYIVESTTELRFVHFMDKASYSSPPTNGVSQPWKGYGTYQP